MDVKKFLRSPSSITGIEISTTNSGVKVFYCTLKKEKSNLKLVDNKEITLEELPTFCKNLKNGFRFLISGKGVLAQNLDVAFGNDFFEQIQGDKKFVLRKDSLDSNISELFKNVNFSGALLGASFLGWAKEVLNLSDIQSFCYTSGQFERANWDLISKTIKIENEDIDSNFTGAYLSALSAFLDGTITTATELEEKTFFENLSIKKGLTIVGLSLLLFAIANFFFFDYLNSQNQILSGNYQSKTQLKNEYTALKTDLENKTKLLDDLGGMNKTFLSFYADEIGFSVPKSVLLTKIFISPLNEELFKKESILEFDKKSISVQGKTHSAVDFNKWVDQLKTSKWIEKIEIENYHYDSQNNQSVFNLKLVLK
jgi:hypothetical protein